MFVPKDGGAASTRLHNSKVHQAQTHCVSVLEDAKRIVMAISFLRQALFGFFSDRRDLF